MVDVSWEAGQLTRGRVVSRSGRELTLNIGVEVEFKVNREGLYGAVKHDCVG